jgi:hypothetical protein
MVGYQSSGGRNGRTAILKLRVIQSEQAGHKSGSGKGPGITAGAFAMCPDLTRWMNCWSTLLQVPRTAQAAVDIVYHLSIGLRSIECEQW